MKSFVIFVAVVIISSPFAFGSGKNNKATTKTVKSSWISMSPETRTQMADMHQKMADCLKSDKSISECRDNMVANCPMMKDGSCPMMGMMKGHGDYDCMMHR